MNSLKYINDKSLEIHYVNNYLKVPLDLCIYAFTENKLKPFRLFIFLTSATQGNIILTGKDLAAIRQALKIKSNKTISNNLKILLELNWIGYDKRSKKYWIRGFDQLRKKLDLANRKAVEFGPEYLENFSEYCFSAILGRIKIFQEWRARAARMKRRRAFQNLALFPGFWPIANIYISKYIKISLSGSARYKRLAQKAGYLKIKKALYVMPIKPNELPTCKSNDFDSFKSMYAIGKHVVQPGPDYVKVFLTYRRRKKIVT